MDYLSVFVNYNGLIFIINDVTICTLIKLRYFFPRSYFFCFKCFGIDKLEIITPTFVFIISQNY